MITAEQVADLHKGDVVELTASHWPEGTSWRGPLYGSGGELRVAGGLVRDVNGAPIGGDCWSLTVVSRAPRLYVNYPRPEIAAGDVVRDADDDSATDCWHSVDWGDVVHWYTRHGDRVERDEMPARLRLLVDGETGQSVGPDAAEGWAEGFEAAAEWLRANPGPTGIPHDPPSNPYLTGQAVPS